jgi:hypothetical protein
MKTHRFDSVSFFSGVVITAIGLLFLLPDTPSDVIDAVTSVGNWFWPALLLAIGTAVLVPVFTRDRGAGKDEEDQSPPMG